MRYSRQEIFSKIGKEGQNLLKKSKVAVIGLGATGSSSAELLARAGVGELILADRDIVELNNLQRQSLYNEDDIGNVKADSIKNHLKKINSEVKIKTLVIDLDYRNINEIKTDLILDCSDNIDTRNLINEYCHKNKINWIYSGVIEDNGIVLNFNNDYCFSCVFESIKADLLGRGVYQIKGKKIDLGGLEGIRTKYFLVNDNFTVFNDGRALIKAESKEKAKTLYSKYIGKD